MYNEAKNVGWLEENQIAVSVTLFLPSDEYSGYVDIVAKDFGLIQA